MVEENPNMVQYLTKLNAGDKAIICAAVRTHSRDFKGCHPGMLPFLPIRLVVSCVMLQARQVTPHASRTYATVLGKLESHKWPNSFGNFNNETAKLLRKLDDGLVAKRLGLHPERGVPIPGLAAVIKRPRDRKMFEKATDAFDSQHPMMTLKRLDEGFWQISCPEKYRHYVDMWLLDYCTR